MNTRYCNKCGQEKSLDDFPKNKTKPKGHGYTCKECHRVYARVRAKTPKKIAQVARWHQSEHGKEMARVRRAERYASNKERYKAKEMIERLINKGIIRRQPCVQCGKENSQGHHPDYSKPLEVVWLCQLHHSEEHRKLNNLTEPKILRKKGVEMEAKYTVMSKDSIAEVKYLEIRDNPEYQDLRLLEKSDAEDKALVQVQAAISFKAGLREVVEWVDEHLLDFVYDYSPTRLKWQAKLKEWGIE